MSILQKLNSALKQEGLGYVVTRAPHYIRWRVQSKISDGIYRICNRHGKLSRSDMISHCESNNQIWYYGSHDKFEIKPPLTGSTPEPIEKLIGVHESPQLFVCELNDIRLVGDRAIPRTKDGKFVLEEMGTEAMLKSRLLNDFFSSSIRRKLQKSLTSPESNFDDYDYEILVNMVPRHGAEHNNFINFGHWFLEDLPRLRGFEHYREQTDRTPRILVKQNPPSWMLETLRLLGFSSSDWIEWDRKTATVSRYVIPKLNYVHSRRWEYNPAGRKWVSDRIKSNVEFTDSDSYPERVFVSRQGQSRRKITNFEEVMSALGQFGFQAIRPEDLSIVEQIKLFDQADFIIGPSGSAFTNVIFSTDATLIQILPYGVEIPLWYGLAGEMGLQYGQIEGKPLKNEPKNDRNSNILVEVGELVESVEEVCNCRS